MKKAWYILNYHNISWEENAFIRPIGGSFPPDLFEEHILALKQHFEITGIDEAYHQFSTGNIQKPLLSIWFDDGLLDVRKYAYPILKQYGFSAGASINSSMLLREETFWRFELGWLHYKDQMHQLRAALKNIGVHIPVNAQIREYFLDHFTMEMRDILHQVFIQNISTYSLDECKKMYDHVEGLKMLAENGWHLANHTASHYPVSEAGQLPMLIPEFQKCGLAIKECLGIDSPFWVLPFDRKPAPNLVEYFNSAKAAENKVMVHVRNKVNLNGSDPRHVYRLFVPELNGNNLIQYLRKF
jgi:peptidoglycan/xylan/chitin deacetylase (PgdA/CDA1 family)